MPACHPFRPFPVAMLHSVRRDRKERRVIGKQGSVWQAVRTGPGREKGEAMTAQEQKQAAEPRVFVSAKEAQGVPRPDRTDEEIRADIRESVQRNLSALRTLSKL